MQPRQATPEEVERLHQQFGGVIFGADMGGPEEAPDVFPCPVLVYDSPNGRMITVAWELNEIELMQLVEGGTLWLTTWGGLPIHTLEVKDKP